MRRGRVLWAAAALSACSALPGDGDEGGGEAPPARWLSSCDERRGCLPEHRCLCGLCTRECAPLDPCEDQAPGAVCAAASDPRYEEACADASPAPLGLCMRPCLVAGCSPGGGDPFGAR